MWKWFTVAPVAVAVALAVLAAEPPPAPEPRTTPAEHVRLAARFLAGVPQEQQPYLRFLSFHAVEKDRLDAFQKVLRWWLSCLTFEPRVEAPLEVPGSDGRLWAVDLRDYRWNAAAFQAVAERDVVFQEPWCPHEESEYLRKTIGVSISDAVLKAERFPVEAVVWAPQLFRDTIEGDRVPSYYDLLFAQQRFAGGEEKVQEYGHWEKDGKKYEDKIPGAVWKTTRTEKKKAEAKFVDFPRDKADFDKAFGVDLLQKFRKEQQLDTDFGAVVAGGTDDPKNGSVVALHNRILVFEPTAFGTRAMSTFDVLKTEGDKDYTEKLIFGKDGTFKRGQGVQAVFDAQELLYFLPGGGQACLLTNAAGKRIEVADAHVANDTSDTRMNPGVRNPGSCVTCHAPANGVNGWRDTVRRDLLDSKVDVRFADREQFNRFKQFFADFGAVVKADGDAYGSLVSRTTKGPLEKEGWAGAKLAKEFKAARDGYDDPISPAVAAAEVGVSEEELKKLLTGSPRARLGQLARGASIPRSVWESVEYRNAALLYAAQKKDKP